MQMQQHWQLSEGRDACSYKTSEIYSVSVSVAFMAAAGDDFAAPGGAVDPLSSMGSDDSFAKLIQLYDVHESGGVACVERDDRGAHLLLTKIGLAVR